MTGTHDDPRCWQHYPLRDWGKRLALRLRAMGLAESCGGHADAVMDAFLGPIVSDLMKMGVARGAAERWGEEIAAEAGAFESDFDWEAPDLTDTVVAIWPDQHREG